MDVGAISNEKEMENVHVLDEDVSETIV